jgi:hypothetical protein
MTGKIEQVEVITSVQRRRRWSTEEKVATFKRPMRRECRFRWLRAGTTLRPTNCSWRRLYAEGARRRSLSKEFAI